MLDYGCGDGTFLARLAESYPALELGVGLDIAADQIADCRKRLGRLSNLRFDTTDAVGARLQAGSFDLVTCMETLEHCTDAAIDTVVSHLLAACATDGHILISVPIEIGPSLLVKQAARRVAAWCGSRDYAYTERYPLRLLVRQLLAGPETPFVRPVYGGPGQEYHSHYGFNWKRLRLRLERDLRIVMTSYTPLRVLGSWANSQAWFLAVPR